MTYFRPIVVGNFRKTPTELRKSKKPSRQLRREGNDPKHLAFVRKLPCALCGSRVYVQAHHLKQGTGERSFGMKATDRWTIPLCSAAGRRLGGCHLMIELAPSTKEQEICGRFGLPEPLHLALNLYANTGDLKHCARAIYRHRSVPFSKEITLDHSQYYELGPIARLGRS